MRLPRCAAARLGHRSTSTVATEAFFDAPIVLAAHEPDLYEVLRDFYRQDPAERLHRAARGG